VGGFKAGSFLLAIEAGLTVVPLSVVGTRFVMSKGRLTTSPGSVALTVHRPIETADGSWVPTVDDAKRLAADVHSIIAGLVEAGERTAGTWPSD
jgi:1-acyl-sn-glycerol-3-phosphate acyltransferase